MVRMKWLLTGLTAALVLVVGMIAGVSLTDARLDQQPTAPVYVDYPTREVVPGPTLTHAPPSQPRGDDEDDGVRQDDDDDGVTVVRPQPQPAAPDDDGDDSDDDNDDGEGDDDDGGDD